MFLGRIFSSQIQQFAESWINLFTMRLFIILFHLAIAAIGNDDIVDLPGHMQPIGSHRPPEESISVLPYVPNPLEFYEEYVTAHTPVLFKGAILGTPALTKWKDDEYLR